jgi:hypothetical protein
MSARSTSEGGHFSHRYPAEQECAFPPLASTEVVGTRVDGSCVVVEMQVSMRGGGRSTLTQNISRLKRSHTELLESVRRDHGLTSHLGEVDL